MSAISTEIRRQVRAAMATIRTGIRRVTLGTGGSSTFTAQLEGIDDETFEGAEIWHTHGLTSRPPTGTEAIAVEPDGGGEGAIVVATANRSEEPAVAAEEVVLYGKKAVGSQPTVRLQANGDILITGGSAAMPATITINGASGSVAIDSGFFISIVPGALGNVGIGSAAAVDYAIKGTAFNAAVAALYALWTTYIVALEAVEAEWKTAADTAPVGTTPWKPQPATQLTLKTATANLKAGIVAYNAAVVGFTAMKVLVF